MMGVRKLNERLAEEDSGEILSFADAVGLVRSGSRQRTQKTVARPYTIPMPSRKPEPYATVELDYVGDFREEGKDPYSYVLSSLNLH